MAFVQYLNFNGTDLPLPDSYEVDMKDVESDASGETEAGTTQRDIVRTGMYIISVSFSVSSKWLKRLTEFKQLNSITVKFFDPNTLDVKETEMFIDGYKVSLVKDTSNLGLWKVNFTINEF
ncbi:hypothetical protein [Oceanobacillus massiliensis]|uniref:hypothetical protein n=1 Tax=Oceanobacillus massiliensis TaxID=1465765 RepID=UPI00028A2080|nr:hypothetical protein [Oceanobacillus massiliensis]MBB2481056.1 hypothetical protein [Bacillus sp. APMAM]RTZ55561.1 hypothetical protein EKO25_11990 [Bacillus sp. SAJ1]